MTASDKKTADTSNAQGKPEGGPAVLHPTRNSIAYTPLPKKRAVTKKNNEEEHQDGLGQ